MTTELKEVPQKKPGRVMVFSNGVWKPIMSHPIFSGAYAKPGFRALVSHGRKHPGQVVKYHGHSFKVEPEVVV